MLLVCILSLLSSAITPVKEREFVEHCFGLPCEIPEPGDRETVA